MNPLDRLRPIPRWLSPVLGLVMLLGTLTSGLHHHRGTENHHHRGAEDHRGGCAVCSVGQASAVIIDAAPAPGGLPTFTDPPLTAPELAHACSAPVATSPRAPPLG